MLLDDEDGLLLDDDGGGGGGDDEKREEGSERWWLQRLRKGRMRQAHGPSGGQGQGQRRPEDHGTVTGWLGEEGCWPARQSPREGQWWRLGPWPCWG